MKAWLAILLILTFVMPASAHDFLLGDLQIIHPSIPGTPVNANTAPVYMVLANDGTEPERLLGVETPFGRIKFLKPVTADDGSVRMEELAWIDIPAGEIIVLDREDMRGRLFNVNRPLQEGEQLTGTMIFQKRGRFDMFFLIDPVEIEEDPSTPTPSVQQSNTAQDVIEIAEALRAALNAPKAAIAPVAIAGDVAVAGWTAENEGARAFLRRSPKEGWTVELWSNAGLLLPATLTSLGVAPATGERLRREMNAREAALGPAVTALFDAFPGTAYVTANR